MAHRPHPSAGQHPAAGQEVRPSSHLSGKDLYRWAAPIYDACTFIWSGSAIWNSRRCQIARMQPGSRALYAGAGQGRAAILAAQAGVRVTYVDISPSMLRLARSLAKKAQVSITFVHADLATWEPETLFDHVVANHFFNVFHPGPMRSMRERLIGFLHREGTLHVADFRPLHGNAVVRIAQRLHHIIPLSGCAALTRNALHPIYDHGTEMQALGWPAPEILDHRVGSLGPAWYRTWFFKCAQVECASTGTRPAAAPRRLETQAGSQPRRLNNANTCSYSATRPDTKPPG